MASLDAKHMALALNAAVDRRRPSRSLVAAANRRILQMRDDPVRDYVFSSKTMAQLLAALSRCPASWLSAPVLDTLCRVIIDGYDGYAALVDGGGGVGGGGRDRGRPWRLGSMAMGAAPPPAAASQARASGSSHGAGGAEALGGTERAGGGGAVGSAGAGSVGVEDVNYYGDWGAQVSLTRHLYMLYTCPRIHTRCCWLVACTRLQAYIYTWPCMHACDASFDCIGRAGAVTGDEWRDQDARILASAARRSHGAPAGTLALNQTPPPTSYALHETRLAE